MGMEKPYHYRKAQVPVKMVHGQLETGFYKRSHNLYQLKISYQDQKLIKPLRLFVTYYGNTHYTI